MEELKDLLLSEMFKDRNFVTIDNNNYKMLKLGQGKTLAYRMCDKTLAVEMRQALISDYEIDRESQDSPNPEITNAHFDMAYLDI